MNIEKVMQTLGTITCKEQIQTVLYMAEQKDGLCDDCAKNDGKIFQIDDPRLPLLPVHPHCCCKYVSSLEPSIDVSNLVEQYRIVQALQKTYHLSEKAAYILAEQILQSRKENKTLREQKIFFLFNGQYFLSSDGKLLIPAVSGKPISVHHKQGLMTFSGIVQETTEQQFDYSFARQGLSDTGGIPCGLYYIKQEEERSASTSPWSHIVKSASWGNYAWFLHPCKETDTRDRGDFFIHGGAYFGSGGCIDLRDGDKKFRDYFAAADTALMYVYVRYAQTTVQTTETQFRYVR